ncbi:hypothetical protein A1Q2_06822 [Trichosporon asahii var. asahii CBS 8904]|uniref:Uncharacterized protein n=2 Tax=Trichosporon asahii var. asahii TaxID=189963 RepID=K1VI78_TRIAC|nr:hypothetical protein A1Q1_00996 [Trichosporon asahii var. asahii CBS 2479]EJT49844.1 hypothetical protein A1Q1_00996 [Trichosporon asahii var. asahii CBS 2479]EKC98851.1 hypothetical protein A1Q2_06822 [Trichosporon asahii var. asahii CBS 8904]
MPVIRAAEPRITPREGYNLASPQHPSSQYPELVSEHTLLPPVQSCVDRGTCQTEDNSGMDIVTDTRYRSGTAAARETPADRSREEHRADSLAPGGPRRSW